MRIVQRIYNMFWLRLKIYLQIVNLISMSSNCTSGVIFEILLFSQTLWANLWLKFTYTEQNGSAELSLY